MREEGRQKKRGSPTVVFLCSWSNVWARLTVCSLTPWSSQLVTEQPAFRIPITLLCSCSIVSPETWRGLLSEWSSSLRSFSRAVCSRVRSQQCASSSQQGSFSSPNIENSSRGSSDARACGAEKGRVPALGFTRTHSVSTCLARASVV